MYIDSRHVVWGCMRGKVNLQHPDRSAEVAPWQLFKPQGVKLKERNTVVIWIAS